jgi:glycosyltransferase involved in cell wall biosynthesis
MMRIFHIISGLGVGGAELFLERLISTMPSSDFNHSVVSLIDLGIVGKRLQSQGVNVIALKTRKATLPKGLWKLRSLLRTEKPDLIQGWLYNGNISASITHRLAGMHCPVVWNIRHSLDEWRAEPWDTKLAIRICGMFGKAPNRIVFNSARAVLQHEKYGYEKARSVVIPNGFDCDRFEPDKSARTAMRRKIKLSDADVVVGTMGRYHVLKNQVGFLYAASMMLKSRPELKFLMAGCDVTPDNMRLSSMVQKLGLTENVVLLGEVLDTRSLLNSMDVFVSPSLAEGFPNAVGEAMACGLPCVVTDAGASGELIGNTGRVVARDDPKSLSDAVVNFLEAGRECWQDHGNAARQRIVQQFNQKHVAARYAAMYRQLIEPVSD